MLAGGAYGAKKYVSSSNAIRDNIRDEAIIQQYVQEHTDPELEAEWTEKVMNPAYYDEIWTLLERYKRSGGRDSLFAESHTIQLLWNEIGTRRPVIFNQFGRPLKNPENVSDGGYLNGVWTPYQVLRLIMHTYGKQTKHEARMTMLRQLHPF